MENINYLNSIEKISENIYEKTKKYQKAINSKIKYLDKDENNREIHIYKLEGVSCTGISLHYPNLLLYTDNKLYLPIREKTMSLNSNTIYENLDMKYDYLSTNESKYIRIVNEENLFFFNYNTDNYYHFIYDSLPVLWSYIYLRKTLPDIKLLIYYPDQKKNFCEFVYEFLSLLDISKNDIVIADKIYYYSNLYVSTSYTHDIDSNLPPRKEVFELYSYITKKTLQYDVTPNLPKNIYISRRTWKHNNFTNIGTNYTTRRELVNETALVDKLLENNYTEIFTEQLSTIEKIHMFNNADNVIGAIGGGIANIIFSKPTCNLLAIVSPYFLEINSRFKYCLDYRQSNLNANKTIYFMNSSHVDNKSIFQKYMRVKIKNTQYIGEIIQIIADQLIINCTDGSNTGWNNDNEYKQMTVSFNNVEKLDNGLNSPFTINIDEFFKCLKTI